MSDRMILACYVGVSMAWAMLFYVFLDVLIGFQN